MNLPLIILLKKNKKNYQICEISIQPEKYIIPKSYSQIMHLLSV